MSFVLTVNGSGFTSQSVVRIDDVDQPTVMVSHTQLQATVDDAVRATPTTELLVTVFNPTPGGGETDPEVLTVTYGVPTITLLTPSTAVEDGISFSVAVTGTKFAPVSQARWEGSNRTTTYVSPTSLTVQVLNTDITAVGTYQIDVVNPTPGGGTSATADFEVTAAIGNDQYYGNVVCLLRSSTGVFSEMTGLTTATVTGGGAVSTVQKKFGTHSFLNPGTITNGTNYLTLNDSSQLYFQFPGPFTWEAWVYVISYPGTANGPFLANNMSVDVTTNLLVAETPSATSRFRMVHWTGPGAGVTTDSANNVIVTGTWQHWAVSRDSSNVIRAFVNGTQVSSVTRAATFGADLGSGATLLRLCRALAFGGNADLNCYFDEVRITKGVARYTAGFSVPTTIFSTSWNDPSIADVKLLCHFNGVDAAVAFTSDDAGARTATFQGNAQLDTAQKKFGSASLLLDGTGDYIEFPDSADWNFGSGDFTVEAWIRFNSNVNRFQGVVAQWGNAADRAWAFYAGDNRLSFYWTSVLGFENAATMANNTWYHVAVCRNGNNLRFFLNGVQQGSTQSVSGVTITNETSTLKVGRADTTQYFNGWIDEVRVTKGTARYTADFTPPFIAFPVI